MNDKTADDKKKLSLQRFGRYLILDHLVDGGMASICRARFLGEQADKIVAIKMVQPQFSKDESFKTMFMDEIKVTFGLLHPNIAQTYDYGIHNEQLYTAMEYVDGKNLKQYLDKLKEKKFVFPVEISVYIISQVCQGLHYSHTLTDKLTGKKANIIHRDISPHNIMLTYDGAVKVIDFGIAKAETNSEATQVGTIKGKLSYLAPEYLDGMDLDPRYDEFAVGITLWELLCSRKLFKAKNDLAVLKQIQACKIPAPSSINPNVPKALDEIVLKALAKDRNKRYEDLDQLNRALVKFLYSNYADFNATDLSYFAKELFKDHIKKDREKLFEFGKIDLKPFLEDLKKEADSNGKSSGGQPVNIPASDEQNLKRTQSRVLDFGFEEEEKDLTLTGTKKTSSRRSRTRTGVKIKRPTVTRKVDVSKKEDTKPQEDVLQNTEEGIEDSKQIKSKQDKTITTVTKSKKVTVQTPKGVSPKLTRTNMKVGQSKKEPPKKKKGIFSKFLVLIIVAVTGYTLLVRFGDSIREMLGFEAVKTPETIERPQVSQVKKKTRNIELTNFQNRFHRVFINGEEVKPSVLGEIAVAPADSIVLRVQQENKRHFVTYVDVKKNGAIPKITIPEMQEAAYAYLKTSRECVKGKLFFNLFGEDRVAALPMKSAVGLEFALDGPDNGEYYSKEYEVSYQKEGEGLQRKLKFTVENMDESIDLCDLITSY